MKRFITVTCTLALVLGVAGCGGGGTSTGPTTGGLKINPDSGPSGTTIKWSISGCEPSDKKSASLYALPLDKYRTGAHAKLVLAGGQSKATNGTMTVPIGTPAGEYTFAVGCLSATPSGSGQVTLGVKTSEVAFTVTG